MSDKYYVVSETLPTRGDIEVWCVLMKKDDSLVSVHAYRGDAMGHIVELELEGDDLPDFGDYVEPYVLTD